MELTINFSLVCTSLQGPEQASIIARELINQKLAICCWIRPMHSAIYAWEGDIREEMECELICKTIPNKVQEIKAVIEKLHPYEVPYIAVFEGNILHDGYGKWMGESLS
ncbi:MAG: divalent-cation tolerance protein CutA [Candidatus Kapaibacteriota bacterium]